MAPARQVHLCHLRIPSKTRDYGRTANRIAYSASCFYLWICSGNPGANPGDHSPLGSSNACRLERAPDFDFCEADTTKTGSRTSAVLMIAGSPYYRLVQVNGEDLSPAQDAAEQERLTSTIQQRQRETPDEKTKRIAKYQKERYRDQQLLEQFTDAMNFYVFWPRGRRFASG
jgi:hypothetical protein